MSVMDSVREDVSVVGELLEVLTDVHESGRGMNGLYGESMCLMSTKNCWLASESVAFRMKALSG